MRNPIGVRSTTVIAKINGGMRFRVPLIFSRFRNPIINRSPLRYSTIIAIRERHSDGRSTLDVGAMQISWIDDNWCMSELEDLLDLFAWGMELLFPSPMLSIKI